MSGFWGELSLSGERLDPENFDAMDSAMSYWGQDAKGRWQEGPVALGTRLSRVTPRDAFDVQPVIEHDVVFVGHARLDDRATLGRVFGLDASTLATTPDSRLLIHAWRKWGDSCATQLYGDWVCAIWNRQQRTLWLGRDAAGNTGLYYWNDSRRVVFSTSIKALLAHPAVERRPNAYQIARQLAMVVDPSQEASTAWEGIRRLPGGQAIRCEPSGIVTYEWWHPESLGDLELAHDDDYYEAFREIYSNAVADRLDAMRGPVSIMLSGGLDSGSVAAFAAATLATRGERLVAYTSVPRFSPDGAPTTRLGDEGPLARAIADHVGNTDHVLVDSATAGVAASVEELLRVHDQPDQAVSNQYWILEILGRVRDRGGVVLLTGQGGNGTVSWSGDGNLWPSLRRGAWSVAFSAFRDSEIGAWLTLKRRILRPVLVPCRDSAKRLLTRGREGRSRYSPINDRFAQEIDLYGRVRAAGLDPLPGAYQHSRHPRIIRFRLGRMGSGHVGATWMELGAAYQLDVRDPTRDRRLIEFCWRVPDRVFWADGLRRGLIVRGMRGLMPDEVLRTRRKGLQAADIGHRILADREAVTNAIDRIDRHPLAREWLDVPRMRSTMNSLQGGVTPESTKDAAAIILRGICVGLFLTRF